MEVLVFEMAPSVAFIVVVLHVDQTLLVVSQLCW